MATSNTTLDGAEFSLDLDRARGLYMQEKFEEAQALCEELLRRNQQRPDLLLLAGACCYQLRDTYRCIGYNRQALLLDPSFPEAYGNMANAFKELGDLDNAIELYLKALSLKPTSLHPRFVDALSNLASAYMQKEMYAQAIDAYQKTLAIDPNLPDTHCSLGNLLKHTGERAAAKQCYTNAIRLRPDYAVAWNNLAGACKDDGDLHNAIACYREALRLNPEMADATSNLGNALKESGFLDEAIATYNQALRLRPDFAIALGNLASVYYEKRELRLAVQTYRRAVAIQPNFPDACEPSPVGEQGVGVGEMLAWWLNASPSLVGEHALNNLGNAMKDKGNLNESSLCYQMAIQICPNFAAAHSNLASLLKDKGGAYLSQAAVALKPNYPEIHSYLASTYKDVGKIPEAIACYRKALQLKPWFPDALCNLVHTYQFVSDWSEHASNMKLLEHCLDRQLAEGQCPSMQPFHAFMYPIHLSKVKQLSSAYAQRALQAAKVFNPPPFTHPPLDASLGSGERGGRLRVGYVSSDFCNHPLGHLMQSVFGMHDTSLVEVYCYSLRKDDGSVFRKTIEKAAEHFREVSHLDSLQIANQINSDGIHVLVNLNGYTKGGRNEIFAMRPCGVQLLYMGFPGTMGADFIDYLVTDRSASPPHLSWVYHEKLLYMPNSYFCNDHRQSFNGPHCRVLPPEAISSHFVAASQHTLLHPPLAPYEWYVQSGHQGMLGVRESLRRQHDLPPFAILFCCFNQLYKLEPSTFSTWCSILKAVPNSALWLLRFPALCVPNLYSAAAAEGIPNERIIFSNVSSKASYIARASLADVFLDTPWCNGHTTGCDVLWAGVPLLTCQLESMCSRVAGSLCRAVGMPELVCADMSAYLHTAIRLGTDREYLLAVRRKLWANRLSTPLFDTRRWTAEWDRALVCAWRRHCNGLPPDHLDSPPLEEEEEERVRELNDADEAARFALFKARAEGKPIEPGRIGQPLWEVEEPTPNSSVPPTSLLRPAHSNSALTVGVCHPPLGVAGGGGGGVGGGGVIGQQVPIVELPVAPAMGGAGMMQLDSRVLVMPQPTASSSQPHPPPRRGGGGVPVVAMDDVSTEQLPHASPALQPPEAEEEQSSQPDFPLTITAPPISSPPACLSSASTPRVQLLSQPMPSTPMGQPVRQYPGVGWGGVGAILSSAGQPCQYGAMGAFQGQPHLPMMPQPVLPMSPHSVQPLQLLPMQPQVLSMQPQAFSFGHTGHVIPAAQINPAAQQYTAKAATNMMASNQLMPSIAVNALPLPPSVASQQHPAHQPGILVGDMHGGSVLILGQPHQPHQQANTLQHAIVQQMPPLVPVHPA
ncbi:MAG: hypothetical protein SGPRY_001020 [Prymnesium sp.]